MANSLTDSTTIIDVHTHIWSADTRAYPWAPHNNVETPTRLATAEELLAILDPLGITGAVCIQPRVYGYDHGYLNAMLQTYPNRFVGVCLANPVRSDSPQELRYLVENYHYRGLRLNPMADSHPDWLDGSSGKPLWNTAIDLGLVVSVLIDPHQLERLSRAAANYTEATIIVDHLGRCTPQTEQSYVEDLLRLSDHPQVSVKISALSTLSEEPYPYPSLHPLITKLYQAFGAERLLWGTDFPHILDHGPYGNSLRAVQEAMPMFKPADLRAILGGNAIRLYRFPVVV